ncbi:NFACT family protein [Clostridium sp. DFI.5.61]|uniref:Rqc2 family fibronectin-binding protein n=1 Tax=unclassified Clostridium TaxID=2614128 RepID=UPI002109E6E3|nr:NFACT RNA binding domain-containing protein [Clostridium sp. DFI.5.61]MCB5927487.1 NFACT family protein [bacterium 210820-DFI.5.26]MCQ5160914.1 NFACT family protein [Clostridium sp. DFI.5.61]
MPLDALCLSGVVHELQNALSGAKIDKIYQPGRDEVVLALRAPAGNVKLLLSANPSHPRAHLTQISRENPDKPPMFCMLLRKHLSGARLLELLQPPMERVVDLRLEALDELGDRVERRLVLEAMGRHSNLILLDGEGRIMDCLRRVDSDMSARRQVLPGLFYRLPPAQEKLDPSSLDRAALESALAAAPEESQADKWLLDTFGGLSPLICRELAFRAGGATDARLHQMGEGGRSRLLDELEGLLRSVQENSFTPVMLEKEGHPSDFTFQPISQYGPAVSCVPFPSFSALLDRFYEQRENQERVRQRGQDLIRSVTNARDRAARKIGLQEQELAATRDRERLRQFGDIITSNLHAMEKGMSRLTAADFYDPECPQIHIPLDPLLTPQQNAAKYYKEYNKAKTAESILTLQLEKGRRDLDYLNSVLEAIALAEGERDLQEIRQELTDTGYLRRPSKARDRGKRVASKPMEFRSSSGLRISVGKNNTQNDLLTTKQAFKSDLWFHTQKIHGSHVILWTEGGQPDLTSIQEAAQLAAWFSQGRASGKVAVDYTPVKYVKKPGGARPGMVVYTTYETAYVAPDGELARRLRVK